MMGIFKTSHSSIPILEYNLDMEDKILEIHVNAASGAIPPITLDRAKAAQLWDNIEEAIKESTVQVINDDKSSRNL